MVKRLRRTCLLRVAINSASRSVYAQVGIYKDLAIRRMSNRASLAIDFASVSDLHHVDTSGDVINAVNYTIVALSNAKAFGFA